MRSRDCAKRATADSVEYVYASSRAHVLGATTSKLIAIFIFALLVIVLAVVRRSDRRIKEATRAALYNAQLWAQSEAQRYECEMENARLRGSLDTSLRCYAEMSRVAREAIKNAEIKADVPEHLRMVDDDSILNSDHFE